MVFARRRRFGQTASFVAGATILVGLIGVQWTQDRSKPPHTLRFQPKQDGVALEFSKLSTDERIVIAVDREHAGDPGRTRAEYHVRGPGPLELGVFNFIPNSATGERIFASGHLSPDDGYGLDAWLMFLRQGIGWHSHFYTRVTFRYYRDERQIGEEQFVYPSSMTETFRWENGRIKNAEDHSFGDFPKEIFAEITPPWLLEERLSNEGAAPHPYRAPGDETLFQP